MDLFTPVVTGALLALFTAIQVWINKGRFDALDRRLDLNDRRMDAHEQNNERRFEQVFSEIAGFRKEIVSLRSDHAQEIGTLRSDLLQVVLALQPKQQTG